MLFLSKWKTMNTTAKQHQCLILLWLIHNVAAIITPTPTQSQSAAFESPARAFTKTNYADRVGIASVLSTQADEYRRNYYEMPATTTNALQADTSGLSAGYANYYAGMIPKQKPTADQSQTHFKQHIAGRADLIRGFQPTTLTAAGQHYAAAAIEENENENDVAVADADAAHLQQFYEKQHMTNDDYNINALNYAEGNADYNIETDTAKAISDLAAMQRSLVDTAYGPSLYKEQAHDNNNRNENAYENAASHYHVFDDKFLSNYFTPTTTYLPQEAVHFELNPPLKIETTRKPVHVPKINQSKRLQLQQQTRDIENYAKQQQLQQQLYQQYKAEQEKLHRFYAKKLQHSTVDLSHQQTDSDEQEREKRSQPAQHALQSIGIAAPLPEYDSNQQPFASHPPVIRTTVHHSQASAQAAAGIPLAKHTTITKHIPITHYQRVHVPYIQKVPIPVPKTVVATTTYPHPIHVPISKAVAVPELRELKIAMEKVKPFPVERPVPYIVERHVPYPIEKPKITPIFYPFPVKVPIVRTIVHKLPSQRHQYETQHSGNGLLRHQRLH